MSATDDPDFALRHPAEILAILERMQREQIVTTVEFGDGHAIVSSVLEVRRAADARAGTLIFDVARDAEVNRLLFVASSLVFVSEIDYIPVYFETRAPSSVVFTDGPAAMVDLPLAVTRLQRREWFRVALPERPSVHCTVLDSQGHATSAQAIDLSCGGAAVVVDDSALREAQPGSDHELILSIPDVGRVEVEATLRTVRPRAGSSDASASGIRLGFRFDGVSAKTASHIQRYVQRLEVSRSRAQKRR